MNDKKMYWELYVNRAPTDEDKVGESTFIVSGEPEHYARISRMPRDWKYYLRNASQLTDLRIAEPNQPQKTIQEWFEQELPDGYRERALRQADPDKFNEICDCMDDAIYEFHPWHETDEGGEFWNQVGEYYMGNCDALPDLPDLGYGTHRETGEELTVPPEWADEWEIVPEGEKLPQDKCPWHNGTFCKWKGSNNGGNYNAPGEDGFAHLAGTGNQIRAYARRKQPVDPIAKGYNPKQLTESTVCLNEGYRTLSVEEHVALQNNIKGFKELEAYFGVFPNGYWQTHGQGSSSIITYRTKKPEGYFLEKGQPATRIFIEESTGKRFEMMEVPE